jgi:hypothetical protein
VPVNIEDPGFESGGTGVVLDPYGVFVIDEGEGYGGGQSLRFNGGVSTPYSPLAYIDVPSIQDAGSYKLRGWVQSLGIEPESSTGFRVGFRYSLATGGTTTSQSSIYSGDTEWEQFELEIVISEELVPGSVRIVFTRYGTTTGGYGWIDDLEIDYLPDPDMELFLCLPRFRGLMRADETQTVKVFCEVNVAGTPTVTVKNDADTVVTSQALPTGDEYIDFDASGWANGHYKVDATIGDYTTPHYDIYKLSQAQTDSLACRFDENNVFEMAGTKTLPLGLYVTSGYKLTVQAWLDDHLTEMDETETSAIINYWQTQSPTAQQEVYFEAQRTIGANYLMTVNNFHVWGLADGVGTYYTVTPLQNELLPEAGGMRIDNQAHMDTFVTRYAAAFKDQPNLLGWYTMDERRVIGVPDTFHQYDTLRTEDPDHPTYCVSTQPTLLRYWRDSVDVIGVDPYPFMRMTVNDTPMTRVGEWVRNAVDAGKGYRPVWVVLQFFIFATADRMPTAAEHRIMAIMAITEGARGFLWWSFGHKGYYKEKLNDPVQAAIYWADLTSVVDELYSIRDIIMAADATDVVESVSDSTIRWVARRSGGLQYIFAYRPADAFSERTTGAALNVTFTLYDGSTVSHSFLPDTAEYFIASPAEKRVRVLVA